MKADKPDTTPWDQLEQLVKETRNFLTEYDDIVLHKELYRTLFMYHLTYLRDEVIQLMKKFTTLPKDVAEEKEIDCCGLKMSLTKISFFERHLQDYILGGSVSSCELLLNLRRILRRLDHTLEF